MGSTLPGQGETSGQVLFDIDVRAWTSSPAANQPGTHVSAPFEVACYSRDTNRNIAFGSREQLATFSEPKLNVNLGEKFESFVAKADEEDVGIEPVLTALLKNSFDVDGQADIMTYRNNLNKIGTTPYQTRDAWELDCALNGKTVFLDIRKLGRDPTDPQQRLFMYYGYRFESMCTGLSEEPTNANSEYSSITRTRIANHRILLASEIDCSSKQPGKDQNPLGEYIELKTMKAIESDRALNSMYRHRFLKFWLQSYLAGVPNIFLGIRSEAGELLHVKRMKTHELPREARHYFEQTRSRNRWDPFVSLNFLDCVLGSIREACQKHPGSTIRVRFDPLTRHVTGMVVAGPDGGLSPRIVRVRQANSNS